MSTHSLEIGTLFLERISSINSWVSAFDDDNGTTNINRQHCCVNLYALPWKKSPTYSSHSTLKPPEKKERKNLAGFQQIFLHTTSTDSTNLASNPTSTLTEFCAQSTTFNAHQHLLTSSKQKAEPTLRTYPKDYLQPSMMASSMPQPLGYLKKPYYFQTTQKSNWHPSRRS